MKWYEDKIYHAMCFKSLDIQKLWQPKEGDFYRYNDAAMVDKTYIVTYWNLNEYSKTDIGKDQPCTALTWAYDSFQSLMATRQEYYLKTGKYRKLEGVMIWLPRQDQLQELLLQNQEHSKCTKAERLGIRFDRLFQVSTILRWYGINCGYDGDEFESMEQLWLAFVMKEKFNKKWNGEGWVDC